MKDLRKLHRDIKNEARRELRKAAKPLVDDLRAAAPKRSGKLASSIKSYSTSDLAGFGVKWGRRAGKRAIAKARELGYSQRHEGRRTEAYYDAAVRKGHPTAGRYVQADKWAQPVIAKHFRRIEADAQRAVDAAVERFNQRQ